MWAKTHIIQAHHILHYGQIFYETSFYYEPMHLFTYTRITPSICSHTLHGWVKLSFIAIPSQKAKRLAFTSVGLLKPTHGLLGCGLIGGSGWSIESQKGSDHVSIHQNKPRLVLVGNHLVRALLKPKGSAILTMGGFGFNINYIYYSNMHFDRKIEADGRW